MVLWVIACVVEVQVTLQVTLHVSVDVFSLNLEEKAVCVHVQELTPIFLSKFDMVVVEVVHQSVAKIQNTHARVLQGHQLDGVLVHLDGCKVRIEFFFMLNYFYLIYILHSNHIHQINRHS